MKPKHLMLLALSFALASSCRKKKDDPAPEPQPPARYVMLKPGSYWIYNNYHRKADGTETDLAEYDSVYVEKDTQINGHQYAKLVRPSQWDNEVHYLRDSGQYIVHHTGAVLMSPTDLTSVFHTGYSVMGNGDTIYRRLLFMADTGFVVNTPAGIFSTAVLRKEYTLWPGFSQGTDPVKNWDTRFAPGVGMVTEVMAIYSHAPDVWERRLLRYHLAP